MVMRGGGQTIMRIRHRAQPSPEGGKKLPFAPKCVS